MSPATLTPETKAAILALLEQAIGFVRSGYLGMANLKGDEAMRLLNEADTRDVLQ